MTHVLVDPPLIASAATDIDDIVSTLGTANFTAAAPTSGLLAAAGDEVSAAIANLFGAYGREYQAVIGQVEQFHAEFHRTLAAAGFA